MSEVLAAAAEAVAAATAAAVAAAGVRGAANSPCKGLDDSSPGAGLLSTHRGNGSDGGGGGAYGGAYGGSGGGSNHHDGGNGHGGDGSGAPSSVPFAFSTPPRVSPESLRPPRVTTATAARARQERGSRSELGARGGRGARSERGERGERGEREVRSARRACSARGVRAASSFPSSTARQLHIAEPSAVWGHPSEHAHHIGHAFARSPRSCNRPSQVRADTRVSTRAVTCAATRATSPPRSAGFGRAIITSRRSNRPPSPQPATQLYRIQTGCFRSSVAARAASDRAASPSIYPAQLYSSRAAVHLGLTQPGFFGEGGLTTRPVSSPSSSYDARPVAFGSRRPQRPAHVALMSSAAGDATALRSAGSAPSVRGVF